MSGAFTPKRTVAASARQMGRAQIPQGDGRRVCGG